MSNFVPLIFFDTGCSSASTDATDPSLTATTEHQPQLTTRPQMIPAMIPLETTATVVVFPVCSVILETLNGPFPFYYEYTDLQITMHSVKKLDIHRDYGYMYSLNWHLITTLKKNAIFLGVHKQICKLNIWF